MSPHGSTDTRNARRSSVAGFLGTALEYYDFAIYGSAAAIAIGPLFFPAGDGAVATISALATFGVGYIARPVGGVLFGHLGDKIGRKRTLVITLLLMGLATLGIGLLPTYEQVGLLAPILLVVLRLLQGLSAGGETAGSGTLTVEHAPASSRGFFASFTASGAAAGVSLASLVFIPVAAMPEEQLLAGGWRIPFLLSFVVVIVGLIARTRLDESPSFAAAERKEHATPRLPLLELFRWHWKPLLRVLFGSLFGVSTSIFTVFSLAYASTGDVEIGAATILAVIAVGKTIQIFTTILAGWLADRLGRKVMWATCLYASVPSGALFFWSMTTGNTILLFVGGILFTCLASNGIWAVSFPEMFPAHVRYSGFAIGSQVGLTLTGFAPSIALALVLPGPWGWVPVMVFTGLCAVASGSSILFGRETAHVDITELDRDPSLGPEPVPAAEPTPKPVDSGEAASRA